MEISVSLKFPTETYPFPLNFHPRTMGKFWYFFAVIVLLETRNSDDEAHLCFETSIIIEYGVVFN